MNFENYCAMKKLEHAQQKLQRKVEPKSKSGSGRDAFGYKTKATAAPTKTATKSRTTLSDLGDDWIVPAVSLVDEPAVPKAKWVVVKNADGSKKVYTGEHV